MDFYGKAVLWQYFKGLRDLLFGFSFDQIINESLPNILGGFYVPYCSQCGIDIWPVVDIWIEIRCEQAFLLTGDVIHLSLLSLAKFQDIDQSCQAFLRQRALRLFSTSLKKGADNSNLLASSRRVMCFSSRICFRYSPKSHHMLFHCFIPDLWILVNFHF